jgi:NAD(P)-dependent dehydrogenase (short-subunit alcohol dehydrogenase family)
MWEDGRTAFITGAARGLGIVAVDICARDDELEGRPQRSRRC